MTPLPLWPPHARPRRQRGLHPLPFFIVAAVILAGCAAPSAPTTALPKLSDFEACNFKDSTGKALSCRDESKPLEMIAGKPPPPWYCYHEMGSRDSYVVGECTSPTGEGALYLDVHGLPWATDAVARLDMRDGSTPELYRWALTTREGYIVIPGVGSRNDEGGRLGVDLYGAEMHADPAHVAQANVKYLWALDGDSDQRVWLTYELDVDGRPHYFDPMRPHPVVPDIYTPRGVSIQGSDFNLDVTIGDMPFSTGILALGKPVGLEPPGPLFDAGPIDGPFSGLSFG